MITLVPKRSLTCEEIEGCIFARVRRRGNNTVSSARCYLEPTALQSWEDLIIAMQSYHKIGNESCKLEVSGDRGERSVLSADLGYLY